MQSSIYTSRYRDHDIRIVGIGMLDGWHLAVQIKPAWQAPWPTWRDRETRYEDFDEVKTAGMAWARKAIDERLPVLHR
ncbi:MAG: hypothetical protein GAK35_00158 [Herbaspirillum frisingense]|uniref:Uncharacterized protein n=1 Tax=Herbaspirillum frisingense TaxID=92645 RepID=A0A7V8G0A9_9BURK|nr:MAG: hypothetical protein GAK35_00158 [Herbaspirillum frisingense]